MATLREWFDKGSRLTNISETAETRGKDLLGTVSDSVPASIGEKAAGAGISWRALSRPERLRIAGWVAWIIMATLAFSRPLADLWHHAVQSELHSYIPLVPLVTAGLLHIQRKALPAGFRTSIAGSFILGGISAVSLVAAVGGRATFSANDFLGLMALAYVSIIAAGGFLFLGSRWMAAAAFPMTFLVFMVPLPDAAVTSIETASVLASAEASAWLFQVTGTPLLRDGTIFTLPGIVLRIAQECSGIHSTWVLFITSLVASHLFLVSPWRRFVLVAFVVPLAIIRNSVRILVIGLLCVHVGPHMIDSYIHRHGGPVFFALSLVPLLGLVLWLRRHER
jgi:exosortase C (VPDSG-CTERM-specific)